MPKFQAQKSRCLGSFTTQEKKQLRAPIGNNNAEKQKGQNVPIVSTAESLAKEYGVSAITVKRDCWFFS